MDNQPRTMHILNAIPDSISGGGNQFLRALRKNLIQRGCYAHDLRSADEVLFDSYHVLAKAVFLKWFFPQKIFIHRLGPVFSTYRGAMWRYIDRWMTRVANNIADIVIMQSQWSYDQFLQIGLDRNTPTVVIPNAVDRDIFYPNGEKNKDEKQKIRLVAVSWSSNWKKGFHWYQYLDNHLDFDTYEMTFIGNSPVPFQHIRHIAPLTSQALAEALRNHDIYVTGAQDDACSNALLEALACGLPVVALESGGNAEIVGDAGEMFFDEKTLLSGIEAVRDQREQYIKNRVIATMDDVTVRYLSTNKKASLPLKKPSIWFVFYAFLALSGFRLFVRVRQLLHV